MNDAEIHAIAVSIDDGEWFDDTQDMLRFARTIRDRTLEEAAKVCEQNADCCNEGGVLHQLLSSNATAIRGLK